MAASASALIKNRSWPLTDATAASSGASSSSSSRSVAVPAGAPTCYCRPPRPPHLLLPAPVLRPRWAAARFGSSQSVKARGVLLRDPSSVKKPPGGSAAAAGTDPRVCADDISASAGSTSASDAADGVASIDTAAPAATLPPSTGPTRWRGYPLCNNGLRGLSRRRRRRADLAG